MENREHSQVSKQLYWRYMMGALHRGQGPMIIRTQNKVHSKRPDGDDRLIFLTRLLELGDLGQLKEQALHSLLAV